MDNDREDTSNGVKGQGSEDEESEEIEEVLDRFESGDEESGDNGEEALVEPQNGGGEEALMLMQHQNENIGVIPEEESLEREDNGVVLPLVGSLSGAIGEIPDMAEVSDSSTIHEKQDSEQQELEPCDLGQHDTLQSIEDPLISDDDDSYSMGLDTKLTKSNLKKVVSDTDISEIVMQDAASDREVLDNAGGKDEANDVVSDDNESNVSMDNYMEFPTVIHNRPIHTDYVMDAAYDGESVVSDIFEPNGTEQGPSQEAGYSRYDTLRSKYTRPRLQPHWPDDPTLTYLPARGVRSYAPFLKSSPLAGMYMDNEQVSNYLQKNVADIVYIKIYNYAHMQNS